MLLSCWLWPWDLQSRADDEKVDASMYRYDYCMIVVRCDVQVTL